MARHEADSAEVERMVRHVHTRLVSPAQFRAALNEQTARNVGPVSAALALVFAAHTAVYSVRTHLLGHVALAWLSGVTTIFYVASWQIARRRGVPVERVNLLAAGIGLLAGVNCAAGLVFGHTQQSALLMVLAIIGIAIFGRSTALYASIVAVLTVGWFTVAAVYEPAREWREQIIPLGSAVGVSVVAHIIFWRTELRLEETKAQLNLAAAVDELTGLYNRRGFLLVGEQLLRQSVASRVPVTLLFIDIDHMKLINDSGGHAAGDETLRALGDVLRSTFREADILGRLGGDEFCVLLVGSQEGLAADRLREAVAQRNGVALQGRRLAVSVGEVRYLGGSSETLYELIARGDAEMYADKARRRTA